MLEPLEHRGGGSSLTRAAASSMASGRPSRRRQISRPPGRRWSRVHGAGALAEELDRRPSSSGSSGNSRSAASRSGSRLVTRT